MLRVYTLCFNLMQTWAVIKWNLVGFLPSHWLCFTCFFFFCQLLFLFWNNCHIPSLLAYRVFTLRPPSKNLLLSSRVWVSRQPPILSSFRDCFSSRMPPCLRSHPFLGDPHPVMSKVEVQRHHFSLMWDILMRTTHSRAPSLVSWGFVGLVAQFRFFLWPILFPPPSFDR